MPLRPGVVKLWFTTGAARAAVRVPAARSRRAALRQVAPQYRRRRPAPRRAGNARPQYRQASGRSASPICPSRFRAMLAR